MKKISLFGYRLEAFSFAIVLVCSLYLIYLGNWQMTRLKQKNDFISRISANLINPPLIIKENDVFDLYSKIELTGHFAPNQDLFLYGRRSASKEKDGYYLLTPFKANNGKTYLVSRGWLPQTIKNNILNQGSITGHEEKIIAISLRGEEKRIFIPSNDNKNKVWFTLDLNMASEISDVTVKDFYLMQLNSNNLPLGIQPLNGNNLNKIRNDHLEYAITWYSLAGCLLIIYFIYNKKNKISSN